jgi:ketosteroid isomerase-like protein
MKRLLAIVPLGIALVIASCNQAPPPGDPKIIEDLSAAWNEALNTRDLDTLTMVYASNARIMPPNGKMVRGAEGVRATFGAMMDAGLTGETVIEEITMQGNLAFKIGSYKVMDGDNVVDNGKFIETWMKGEDGKWRISNDIWNSNNPPAALEQPMHGKQRMHGEGRRHSHLMILHEVDDAARWLAAWRGENSRHDLFRANGAARVHTFQSEENPNLTGLVIAVKDLQALQDMLSSEEGRAAAKADGVIAESMSVLMEAK